MRRILRFEFLVWLLLVLIGFGGCSTMHYSAQNQPMINLKDCDNATEPFQYTMTGSFFICGLTPTELDINLTQIAQAHGAPNGICDVTIEEKVTFANGLLGCITLGIYVPRTITITGKKIGD